MPTASRFSRDRQSRRSSGQSPYIDRDLNRSFLPECFASDEGEAVELSRAQALLQRHGPDGIIPARWPSICAAPRRPWAFAGGVAVGRLIWLWRVSCRERSDCPFTCTRRMTVRPASSWSAWPCGLVIEVGPVPQSLLDVRIVEQTVWR